MSSPQNNEVVYEASLVEDPQKRNGLNVGCIVGSILACLFFLMIVGLVVFTAVMRPEYLSSPNPQAQQDDFEEVKSFLAKPDAPALSHPDFEKINHFVSTIASRLDGTANPKIQKMIDHRKHWVEVCKRSKANFLYRNLSRSDLKDIVETTYGPPAFENESDYELIQIEETSNGEYRVALSYDYGYESETLFIWWLSEEKGKLLLYDWFDAESGMRESLEYAKLCDASTATSHGHQRHVTIESEYFAIDDDLEYDEFQSEIRKKLTQLESYRGPKALKETNLLITAKRWAYHDEPIEAMRVLEQNYFSAGTPGALLLRARINFSNGFYAEAQNSFEQYVNAVGSYPAVDRKLISCARHLGENQREKRLLEGFCESFQPGIENELSRLIELNNETENQKLFQIIDAQTDSEAIYRKIVNWLKSKPYYRDQYAQLDAHLHAMKNESLTLQLSRLTTSTSTDQFSKVLGLLDKKVAENDSNQRYTFWYNVPDKKMLEVFESTSMRETNFKELVEYYRYEDYYPDCMLRICELVLQENPDSQVANETLATLLLDQGDAAAAIERLKVALENSGKDEDLSSINYLMLRALNESGDTESTVQWAVDHGLISSLLSLKSYEGDFSQLGVALEKLDEQSADYKYYLALYQSSRGEKDTAIAGLKALIENSKANENDSEYRSKWQLRKILTRIDQLEQYVELLPNEDDFWAVATSMIDFQNWDGCQRLLDLDEPDLHDAQNTLRILIDWEYGRYAKLAERNIGDDGTPKGYSNLKKVIGKLVNACVHEHDHVKAKSWASKAEDSSERNELLTGIAISMSDWEQARDGLLKMDRSRRRQLPDHPFLGNENAITQPILSGLFPLGYASEAVRSPEFSISFLFNTQPNPEQLRKQLASAMGSEFSVKQYTRNDKSWTTFSDSQLMVVVKQSSPRYRMPPASNEIDEDELPIQEALVASKFRYDVFVYPRHSLQGVDSAQLFDLISIKVCELEPKLLGTSGSWLTSEQFEPWFAEKIKSIEELETASGIRGTPAFAYHDIPEIDAADRDRFSIELASTLKAYLDSSDENKSFLIETADEGFAADFRVRLLRVNRTDYSSVRLVGVPEYLDNVPHVGVTPGEVSVSFFQVTRFQSEFDGKKIEGSVRNVDQSID